MDDLVTSALAGVPAINEPTTDQLQDLHRLAELGRLSAHLLHEISNPLTAALLHLEQHNKPSANIKRARRSMRVLQRYVESARQQVRRESQATAFYLRPQFTDLRRILQPVARQAGIRLRFQLTANYRLFGDPVKLQQIIANLVVNAIDAYEDSLAGDYDKLVEVSCASRKQWLFISVQDRGTGINSKNLEQIFTPFYSTKDGVRSGLGVGLAMVKQYIETDFGGSISATSTPSEGTCFTLKLRNMPIYDRNKPHGHDDLIQV